jgi:hypothetical protein
VLNPKIVHRDLAARTMAYSHEIKSPRDVATGQASGKMADGGFLPGGPIVSFVSETGGIVVAPPSLADATQVATLAAGNEAQLAIDDAFLYVLEGTPSPSRPGFLAGAVLSAYDTATLARSFSATIGPDMEPDLVSFLVADSGGSGAAFVVNSHATPGVDTIRYWDGKTLETVAEAPKIAGISLNRGRVAYNTDGALSFALASRAATSFSWGLSNTGTWGGGSGGRIVGGPSLKDETVAYVEAAVGANRGDVYATDLTSGLTAKLSKADAGISGPDPVVTPSWVYWTRDAAATQTVTPVGGGVKTFVLPHVLERSGIRAGGVVTSQVATLNADPGALSVGPADENALYYSAGNERRVHAVHRGEPFAFLGEAIVPPADPYATSLTMHVHTPPGVGPIPLSVEATKTRTTSGGGAGKANFQDLSRVALLPPSATGSYTVTIDGLTERTLLRFTFPGDATWGSAESRFFEFAPRPRVTLRWEYVNKSRKTVRFLGSVSNEATGVAGTPAGTLVIERKVRGQMTSVKSNPLYKGNVAGTTNALYESSAKRLSPGAYRARMLVPATDVHEAGASKWISFTIR